MTVGNSFVERRELRSRFATVRLNADMLNKSCTKRKLTRKEQRDLDIEISFMEGVTHRDPKFAEAWRDRKSVV